MNETEGEARVRDFKKRMEGTLWRYETWNRVEYYKWAASAIEYSTVKKNISLVVTMTTPEGYRSYW